MREKRRRHKDGEQNERIQEQTVAIPDPKVSHLLDAFSTPVQSSKAARWSVLTKVGGAALLSSGAAVESPVSPLPNWAGPWSPWFLEASSL